MGVVQRQGLKRSLVQFLGVAIGVVGTLYVYPRDLSSYGLSQFLFNAAEFLGPFLTLGLSGVALRYFPVFQEARSDRHGYLGLLMAVSAASILLLASGIWLFREQVFSFIAWAGLDAHLFTLNAWYVFALCVLGHFAGLFELYASGFNRVVVPSIFNQLLPKAGLILLIGYASLYGLREEHLKIGLLAFSSLSVAGLALYLKHLGCWDLRIDRAFLAKAPLREMTSFAFYNTLAVLGLLLSFRIGNLLVASLLNTHDAGVYSIGSFVSNAIDVPQAALLAVATPIVAAYMREADYEGIRTIYRKAGLSMLAIGLYLFLGVFLCLDDLFRLTPNYAKLAPALPVSAYLGLAKVAGSFAALGNAIIGFSRHYRLTLPPLLLMAALNLSLNFLLIPRMGLTGAAVSALASMVLYQAIIIGMVHRLFGFHPFSRQGLYLVLMAVPTGLLGTQLPEISHPLAGLVLRMGWVTLFFMGPVLWLRLSPDLNDTLGKVWRRITAR